MSWKYSRHIRHIHINAYNNNGGVLVYGKNNVIVRTGLNGNIISDGVTHVLNNNNLNQGYNLINWSFYKAATGRKDLK